MSKKNSVNDIVIGIFALIAGGAVLLGGLGVFAIIAIPVLFFIFTSDN